MPIIPLKALTYEMGREEDLRKLIDLINDNFNCLWYLTSGNITVENINDTTLEEDLEGIPEPEIDLPPALDEYGFNIQYLKFHSNKVYNSSFELYDPDDMRPLYWNVSDALVTPNSNFDNTYACQINPGGFVVQCKENFLGLWNTSWWTWCNTSRISFRGKGSSSNSEVKVEVQNTLLEPQPLKYWSYDDETKEWTESEAADSITFTLAENWPTSFRSFSVEPEAAGEMQIKFINTGSDNIYIDAVTAEPDWNGKWPSIYSHGPKSSFEQQIYVQDTEPSNPVVGDIWIDTSI